MSHSPEVAELGMKPELACARDHYTAQPLSLLIFICLGDGKLRFGTKKGTVAFC